MGYTLTARVNEFLLRRTNVRIRKNSVIATRPERIGEKNHDITTPRKPENGAL